MGSPPSNMVRLPRRRRRRLPGQAPKTPAAVHAIGPELARRTLADAAPRHLGGVGSLTFTEPAASVKALVVQDIVLMDPPALAVVSRFVADLVEGRGTAGGHHG